MIRNLILVVALAGSGIADAANAVEKKTPDADVSRQAKSAFIRKCVRDMTKKSCEAPPKARVKQESAQEH